MANTRATSATQNTRALLSPRAMLSFAFYLFLNARPLHAGDLIHFPGASAARTFGDSGDDRSAVVHRMPTPADEVLIEEITARLTRAYGDLGFTVPPGLPSALASLDALDPEAAVTLYVRGFELATWPYAELGMQMESAAAHAYALEVVYRASHGFRTYELDNYLLYFESLSLSNDVLIKSNHAKAMSREDLSEMVRDTARSHESRLAQDDDHVPWPDRRRLALDAYLRLREVDGAQPVARDFVLDLARRALALEDLATDLAAYEMAFVYARRSEGGLDLDPTAAHEHASLMLTRLRTPEQIRREIDLFDFAFAQLVAQSDPNARARARRLAEDGAFATVKALDQHLATERAALGFLTTSVREGGLAMSPDEATENLNTWIQIFATSKSIDRFTADYRLVVHTLLAKTGRAGRYDETAARDRALEIVRTHPSVGAWLSEQRPRGIRRLATCAIDLATNLGTKLKAKRTRN